jgi:UDP-N-acetylglucosamine 2-epimerase (non-hydrolysing)
MRDVLAETKPDIVLVHGDTTTTMATSLAAYYSRIPVGHVEAGLRTFNKYYPFPEEMNRVLTDAVATLFFAPTDRSCENLRRLGCEESGIIKTGNTVIDALFHTLDKTREMALPVALDPEKRLVLVTVHRRENFGEPLLEICRALNTLVARHEDIELVLPVHPNPNVRCVVHEKLGGHPRIHLIEPMDYAPFCRVMAEATLIMTDSGGVQEEAPSLSKPVLVLRSETERPEAVDMGTVKLVGQDHDRIVNTASELLSNPDAYNAMARAVNPYGDGKASERILDALRAFALQTDHA